MADINVTRDSKLIKVLAAQAKNERVDSDKAEEAAQIIAELASDMSPEHRHQIAQTMAYTIDELQQGQLDFLNQVADIKNVGYGDYAMFNVKMGDAKAVIQAKGSTTPRFMVGGRQVKVDTQEISARPAINIVDLRCGRVNMADLIREANQEMTNRKIEKVEDVLHTAIQTYSTPFYATGTGVVQATLDAQIQYFTRYGAVSLLGDIAAVGQLAPLTGMAMNSTTNQFSGNAIDEYHMNGFIGKYKGSDVLRMTNTYRYGETTPILATDYIYIMANGLAAGARNLKLVNEGNVNAIDSQSIDDMVFECRLDQW